MDFQLFILLDNMAGNRVICDSILNGKNNVREVKLERALKTFRLSAEKRGDKANKNIFPKLIYLSLYIQVVGRISVVKVL